jgi:hypothetical protein
VTEGGEMDLFLMYKSSGSWLLKESIGEVLITLSHQMHACSKPEITVMTDFTIPGHIVGI